MASYLFLGFSLVQFGSWLAALPLLRQYRQPVYLFIPAQAAPAPTSQSELTV